MDWKDKKLAFFGGLGVSAKESIVRWRGAEYKAGERGRVETTTAVNDSHRQIYLQIRFWNGFVDLHRANTKERSGLNGGIADVQVEIELMLAVSCSWQKRALPYCAPTTTRTTEHELWTCFQSGCEHSGQVGETSATRASVINVRCKMHRRVSWRITRRPKGLHSLQCRSILPMCRWWSSKQSFVRVGLFRNLHAD